MELFATRGFSVHEILDMMSTQNFKPLIREIAFTIRKELKFGYSFSNALSRLKFLDQQFITITIHGEKNGRLDDELQFYSRFCVKQLEEKIQKIFGSYNQLCLSLLEFWLFLCIYLFSYQCLK